MHILAGWFYDTMYARFHAPSVTETARATYAGVSVSSKSSSNARNTMRPCVVANQIHRIGIVQTSLY